MVSALLLAATMRVFGSAGAELQLTPANTRSPLNPHNIAAIPYQTNVADAAVFLEASSNDKRWKVRAKLRADVSDRGTDRGEVGEALVQFAPAAWLDITAGRVIEKWGTGYGWTPTAFIGPARNATDPNDRRSADRGRDMVRADVFVKGTSISLHALGGGTFAARAYRLVHGTDVAIVYRRDSSRRDANDAGISVSRVFGDALELHAEVARAGSVRAVVGGQYTLLRDVNVVVELYHGTDGLTAGQWDAFRDSVASDLRIANARYAPLAMARTYGFTRIAKPIGKAEAELITITNLRDGSTLLRASATYRLRPNLSLYALDTELTGGSRTELAYLQVERITAVGVRVYF